jgi:hypothetical protein
MAKNKTQYDYPCDHCSSYGDVRVMHLLKNKKGRSYYKEVERDGHTDTMYLESIIVCNSCRNILAHLGWVIRKIHNEVKYILTKPVIRNPGLDFKKKLKKEIQRL